MIDFTQYENLKLPDVAEFERGKPGKIYPAGSSTIQISVTRGQIGFLKQSREVEAKNVVIIPIAGVDHYYLNVVLQKNVADFCRVFQSGLNIKFEELNNFKIELHNYETQQAIASAVRQLDFQAELVEQQISDMELFKSYMLSKVMM